MLQFDWTDFSYLLDGNERQRAAYNALKCLGVFDTLQEYAPMLVGTIPINVDVAGSDLDIICEAQDLDAFARDVASTYGNYDGFQMWQRDIRRVPSIVAGFTFAAFPVELFAQSVPVTTQNAYRHMVVEARLLELGGAGARRAIRHLKREGLKTEPAFARYFGIDGDPYEALLELYPLDKDKLRKRIRLGREAGT